MLKSLSCRSWLPTVSAAAIGSALSLAVALPMPAEAAQARDLSRASAPRSAVELRMRGLEPAASAAELARQGIREPAAVARVLIAADYLPEEVEQVLVDAFRLPRDRAVQSVREALAAHSDVAGQSALRASVCYGADGSLMTCPRRSSADAAPAADPAVAALMVRLENLEAAAADTVLRQSLRIRDLQRASGDRAGGISSAQDENLVLSGSRRERIDGSTHLTVGDDRLEKLVGSLHQIIGQDRRERIGGNLGLRVDQSTDLVTAQRLALQSGTGLYLKTGTNLVIEAGTGLSLKVGGNFLHIDHTGIRLRSGNALWLGGTQILMSGDPIITPVGGSAGSGSYPMPADPQPPRLPE